MKTYFAVVGDIHSNIDSATKKLSQIEVEIGQPLAQVICVGDVGLSLSPEDYPYSTEKRSPEEAQSLSASIREGWQKFKWPLAMIGGNHEPYNRLRKFDENYFEKNLTYTDVGELPHSIGGLKVYGLSGIYQEEHYQSFAVASKSLKRKAASWGELMENYNRSVSTRALTYYKKADVDKLLRLPKKPHLLLTHDWPDVSSLNYSNNHAVKTVFPEMELCQKLLPHFHFSGHHHTHKTFKIGESVFVGLADVKNDPWAMVFSFENGVLEADCL